MEDAAESEHLVVPAARIERRLDDQVGRDVVAVVDGAGVVAAAGVLVVHARAAHRAGPVRPDVEQPLRTFQRRGQPDTVVVEVLGNMDLRLPGEREARHVLRVDGERDVLAARSDADLLQRGQAPGLAREDVQAEIAAVIGGVGLARRGSKPGYTWSSAKPG